MKKVLCGHITRVAVLQDLTLLTLCKVY